MKKVYLSVIMSTLNTNKEYLKRAIESILNQTFSNFEFIIIVDGGSDDDYIRENFCDERIKIIKHEESLGLPYSLNEAIENSNGKYIARMDSDDISVSNRFEKQIEYMDKNPDVDISSMYYETFGVSNKSIREKFCGFEFVRCKLFFTNIIAHPCVMFRKNSIYKNNLFYDVNYRYSQDFELWNRNKNVNIEIIPIIGLKYRVHNNQISSSKKEEQTKLYYQVLERNLSELDLDSNYLDYILSLNGRIKNKNYIEIYKFINNVIEQNKVKNIYNEDCLKKVLKRQFIIYCIHNKCIFNKYFIMNLGYLF